ncbi:hypothetical protein DRE_04726 [Drechslerella stenobrocha 248]|uniref:Uncharacterized protein n=1 Tax=Drechslerella stenobrocha 248 TaxID=1043628 RepID=W7I124_9PEZI|nr:hypothetical protein DRE_04726 [Drechslerella stenobrocha 248]
MLDSPSASAGDGHAVTAVKDIAYGSFAGMVGKFIEYPFDTVKTASQAYTAASPHAAENAGLFFSYTISQNLLREFAYPAVNPDDKLPLPALVACGAISGASCSLILTPIELIKCKMQVQAPVGFLGTGAAIWREGGLRGLYRGCGITVLRAAPASAVIFLVYETLKAHF